MAELTNAFEEENQQLRQLVRDYRTYLERIAPYSYYRGAMARELRTRTQAALGEDTNGLQDTRVPDQLSETNG